MLLLPPRAPTQFRRPFWAWLPGRGGSLARSLAGTGTAEEGGEGPWCLSLHLVNLLGIYPKESSREEVGIL